LQGAAHGFDSAACQLFDGPFLHDAVLVLGDLPGHEDEVARTHGRMEGKVGILLAEGLL
jgi:hypothetical protein